jgi:LPXTG-motif cell wall-anchored protein
MVLTEDAATPAGDATATPAPLAVGDWIYDIHVYPKNSVFGIDKSITSLPPSIGQSGTFRISADIPALAPGDTFGTYGILDQQGDGEAVITVDGATTATAPITAANLPKLTVFATALDDTDMDGTPVEFGATGTTSMVGCLAAIDPGLDGAVFDVESGVRTDSGADHAITLDEIRAVAETSDHAGATGLFKDCDYVIGNIFDTTALTAANSAGTLASGEQTYFQIVLTSKGRAIIDGYQGGHVVVDYSATLQATDIPRHDDGATAGTPEPNLADVIANTATLFVSNQVGDWSHSCDDQIRAMVGQFLIEKIASDTKARIDGAQFEIYQLGKYATCAEAVKDPAMFVTQYVTDPNGTGTAVSTEVITNAAGQPNGLDVKGKNHVIQPNFLGYMYGTGLSMTGELTYSTQGTQYCAVESQAPAGYQLVSAPQEFTVSEATSLGPWHAACLARGFDTQAQDTTKTGSDLATYQADQMAKCAALTDLQGVDGNGTLISYPVDATSKQNYPIVTTFTDTPVNAGFKLPLTGDNAINLAIFGGLAALIVSAGYLVYRGRTGAFAGHGRHC